MGMICELYRVSDADIDSFLGAPEKAIQFLSDEYASIYGRFHDDETVFSMDKAWAVALYLFKCADDSPEKLMDKIFAFQLYATEMVYYLKSDAVRSYKGFFEKIEIESLIRFLDKENMMQKDVYRGGWLGIENWEYIKSHLDTFKIAFGTAASFGSGIIIAIN